MPITRIVEKAAIWATSFICGGALIYFLIMPLVLGYEFRSAFLEQKKTGEFTGEIAARESIQIAAKPTTELANSWKWYGRYCAWCIDRTLGEAAKRP